MQTNIFQSCGHLWVFQICWSIECSTFTASSFRIWNSSTGIPSPPLALFRVMLPKAHLTSHYRISGSRWVISHLGEHRSSVILGLTHLEASLIAQLVKNLPAMQETSARFLGQEDPLEKGKPTTPVFWPGEFHGLQSMVLQRVGHDWATFTFILHI